jgi:hypothetical protein
MLEDIRDLPWPTIAAFASVATLIMVGWVNFGRPFRRRRKLRKPVIAEFVLPSAKHHACDFAEQDNREHLLKTIVLPAHSEVTVDLRFTPQLNFEGTEISMGCLGAINRIPYATEYFNQFIKEGAGQQIKPGPGNRHYLDKHNYYHIRDNNPRRWTVGQCVSVALKIKTSGPGKYPVEVYFPGDEVEGKAEDLMIVVEDSPRTLMPCKDKQHRRSSCARGIKPRQPRPALGGQATHEG